MKKAHCKSCKKIIINDWEKFLEDSQEKYIQCPYCKKLMINPKFEEVNL